ncbi:MAG TPA: TonB-dependent siderophore receptor [Gemmatimonadales bacterium]|nr:TonB-dependent siderophore receptor [Gemmatimonadales bacterium]
MTLRTASVAHPPRHTRAIRLGTLLVALALGGAALQTAAAQDHAGAAIAIAQAASDTTTKRTFRIPPQPLPAALEEFARQSGVRVRADTEVPVVHSAGVSGRLTPPEALRRLIAGTGLVARVVDDETLAVHQENPDAYVLDPVEVVAKRPAANPDAVSSTATKTTTPLRDVPQAVTVVSRKLIADQGMQSMADVARYVPGVTMGQGEGNRDQPTIRGNTSTSTFFLNGVRDDVQYFRDLYNVERVEGLKGANALIFGRGTGGGVINRVTKEAEWAPTRELTVQGGSYGTRRGAVDVGQGVSETVALRLNGMYENSDRFRHDVNIERYGINPVVTIAAGADTRITANVEHFYDYRTADRGIPSFQGQPAGADARTFFGDPSQSWSDARINVGTALIEHDVTPTLQLRNRTLYGDYDKMYQNVYPGSVDSTGALVSISAYDSRNDRTNLFNQTELTYRIATGSVTHTILGGIEVGRQVSRNLRNTGFFDGTETSVTAPLDHPTISRPLTFRPSETDADNRVRVTTLGAYLQDQVALTPYLQLIAGARLERFDLTFHNFRNNENLERRDDLVSPRAGLVVKPLEPLSFYGSYSVSYLPSAGDQFASLTATTETLEPEKFENYEVGAKLDVATGLSLSAAVYQLDRTNTSAPDPVDPSRTIQTGSQRTKGFEFGATGNLTPQWQVAAGYANQDAYITSQTSQAALGAKVPLVPRNTFSLWNKYQLHRMWGIGVGAIYQDRMFAATDNAVTLPSFTRFDAGAFFTLSRELRAQVNVENVFDKRYFITSHSNNNISPGSPRAVRVSVTAGF